MFSKMSAAFNIPIWSAQFFHIFTNPLLKHLGGWRDDLAVKNTCYSKIKFHLIFTQRKQNLWVFSSGCQELQKGWIFSGKQISWEFLPYQETLSHVRHSELFPGMPLLHLSSYYQLLIPQICSSFQNKNYFLLKIATAFNDCFNICKYMPNINGLEKSKIL